MKKKITFAALTVVAGVGCAILGGCQFMVMDVPAALTAWLDFQKVPKDIAAANRWSGTRSAWRSRAAGPCSIGVMTARHTRCGDIANIACSSWSSTTEERLRGNIPCTMALATAEMKGTNS